jgi:hypothetical protein
MKAPGGFSAEGEGEKQQSENHASPGKNSSAMTKIGGRVANSKVSTKSGSGTAQTEIGGDVQKADIQTETRD